MVTDYRLGIQPMNKRLVHPEMLAVTAEDLAANTKLEIEAYRDPQGKHHFECHVDLNNATFTIPVKGDCDQPLSREELSDFKSRLVKSITQQIEVYLTTPRNAARYCNPGEAFYDLFTVPVKEQDGDLKVDRISEGRDILLSTSAMGRGVPPQQFLNAVAEDITKEMRYKTVVQYVDFLNQVSVLVYFPHDSEYAIIHSIPKEVFSYMTSEEVKRYIRNAAVNSLIRNGIKVPRESGDSDE